MSAIFGLVRQDDGQVDRRDLENMSRALTVHGAYGGASWAVRTAGLGQRLTRLTPEDRFEQQPMVSVDGRLILVFAGRLDNRPELLSELGRGPSAAEVTPDSAILLRALERWGQACVSHLIGDFAFAVWDARQQQLFLARSPLGVHPILYSCGASTFAFATMPKGLFALPFVSRELDSERLADFLVSAPADPEGAFYRGIRRLPAGHCMWVSKRRQEVRRYWARPAETDEAADSTCVETVRSLFDRAVSDRLRCISSVGVMMSGGLDSASVAASAAESLGNERLSTFTEVPSEDWDGKVMPGRYADETVYVDAMRQRYSNLDVNLVRTGSSFFLDGLGEFFQAAEEPYPNASNRVWFEAILAVCQRRGLRAILTGASGNLTVSWSGKGLLPELLRSGRWGRAIHQARALRLQGQARSSLRALAGHGILPLLPPLLWRSVQRLRDPRDVALSTPESWLAGSLIRPEFAREQRVAERAEAKGHDLRPSPVADPRLMRFEALENMNEGLTGAARCYLTRYGVDLRDPTSDQRLVEFCLRLPEEQYLRDGVPRYLMRKSMESRLPEEILNQRQRGQQAADWLDRYVAARNNLLGELEALEQCELAREALDLPRLSRLVDHLPQFAGDDRNVMRDVRGLLDRALMAGRFLRWFESGE